MNQELVQVPSGELEIRQQIKTIRGVQVMLDRDLAELYGVQTKVLNQAVKRNIERFPGRFMFRLADDEMRELVTNCDRFKTMKHSSVATLDMLAKRGRGVKVELVTHSNGELAESDFEAFAKQCGNFMKTICGICHDRFIIADQKEIYWSGASLKDAGRLTFARPCGLPSKARRFFGGYSAKLGVEMNPACLPQFARRHPRRTATRKAELRNEQPHF